MCDHSLSSAVEQSMVHPTSRINDEWQYVGGSGVGAYGIIEPLENVFT